MPTNAINANAQTMKKIMRRVFLFLVFGFYSHLAFSLSLTVEVDRQTIAENESLRLTLTADKTTNEMVDFGQLLHQFHIINTRKSSQVKATTSGTVSASTQWILMLSPKESGQLTIPSFHLDNAYSQPITITVTAAKTPQSSQISQVEAFLQASVDRQQMYVQQQVLLTLRLYYQTALSSYDAEELRLQNTTIELVSENNFQTDFRGQTFNVLELIYALHPQSSGDVQIPAQSWRLDKAVRGFGFGRSGNSYFYVKSDPINLAVKPIPAASTARDWLPSTAVLLQTNWQQSLLEAKVGEPLDLSLILTANGLTDAQLPIIELSDTNDFTVYGSLPKTRSDKSARGVVSTRTSQFAIIPKSAGRFSFPEIVFKWWNIASDREEVIKIPAQAVLVAASNLNPSDKIVAASVNPAIDANPQQNPSYLFVWQLTSATLAIACGVLGFLLIKHRNRQVVSADKKPDQNTTLLKERDILKLMRQAAAEKDWQKLRRLMIQWGKIKLDNPRLESLVEITSLWPELNLPLQQLDSQLYGNKSDDSWNPEALLETLKKVKIPKNNEKQSLLKPLYG